jgi:hypothetical protein
MPGMMLRREFNIKRLGQQWPESLTITSVANFSSYGL